MKVGDLVTKAGGWGKEANLIGVVLEIYQAASGEMLAVLSEGEIEFWHKIFTRIVDESR